MGADIYLKSRFDANKAKWQPIFDQAVQTRNAFPQGSPQHQAAQEKVEEAYNNLFGEGYFRDSYNVTSVLWQLGLSWWRDIEPMLDEEGNLPIENAKMLRDMVKERSINPERVRTELADSPEEWLAYFERKKEDFLKMLDESIRLNEPLHCSI